MPQLRSPWALPQAPTDSSVTSCNSEIRPLADIDMLALGTKMLPPYGLRRLAFRAVGRHTTRGRLRACAGEYRDRLKACPTYENNCDRTACHQPERGRLGNVAPR